MPNTFRDIVLPLASVLETIATAKASKGHFVGDSALQAMEGFDARKRLEEESRQKAIERAAQGELRGLQTQGAQLKLKQAQQAQTEREKLGQAVGKLPQPFTAVESAQYEGGLFKDLLKGRTPKKETDMDIMKQIILGRKVAESQKTPEQKAREQSEAAERKAKLDRELSLKYPKPTAPKPPKEIGEGTLEKLAGTANSIDNLDKMMEGAAKLGLWFNPGDKLRALNPWDTDAQSFQQFVQTTKQVIGKGLEGGVLRKEDEVKYEKIIPKLGDTKEVLINKANQLRDMLLSKYESNVQFLKAGERNVSSLPTIKSKKITFGISPTIKALIEEARKGDKKAIQYLQGKGVQWQE